MTARFYYALICKPLVCKEAVFSFLTVAALHLNMLSGQLLN